MSSPACGYAIGLCPHLVHTKTFVLRAQGATYYGDLSLSMANPPSGNHRHYTHAGQHMTLMVPVFFEPRKAVYLIMMMISQFNGTSTPKGSYRAKTGDNYCNVNSSHYSRRTALCESICYQAKSEQSVRQDLIPRVRHGEAALMHPTTYLKPLKII